MPTGSIDRVSLQVGQAARKIGRNNPTNGRTDAEPIQQIDHVRGEADADGHVRNGVLENQIPSDNPCDQLAHGRVGIGVGAAGDGNHGREFGVTQRRKPADYPDKNERNCNGWAGTGPAKRCGMVNQIFQKRSVQDRLELKLLACDGRADHSENSRADDRADSERSKTQPAERFLQAFFGFLRFGDELVYVFLAEKL